MLFEGVSVMLGILLKILSILGICLLVLFCLAVLVILLVLFFPVYYRFRGEREPEKTACRVKISWLFGFIRAEYQYPEPGEFRIKLLWHKLYPKPEAPETEDDKSESAEKREKKSSLKEEKQGAEEQQKKTTENETSQKEGSEKEPRTAETESQKTVSSGEPDSQGRLAKLKYTIRHIYDTICGIVKQIKDEENRQLVTHILFRTKKLLLHIRPRKCRADILFGTGSPDTTGYLLGIYSILSLYLPEQIDVTPDFMERKLEGHISARGRIVPAVLLFHLLKLYQDKTLRKLLNLQKKHKVSNKENADKTRESEEQNGSEKRAEYLCGRSRRTGRKNDSQCSSGYQGRFHKACEYQESGCCDKGSGYGAGFGGEVYEAQGEDRNVRCGSC